ncbi:sulfatase-like hydrolase/transferase [Flammeovirga sp. SubArs3]|uniref:sulfatase-like hydrolase/transferase n=1 Tax=Flammeovirga sp. SubArs3 TaxID=2995316 RepID=UPI00248BFE88|nr:sulfatase-like hydrolase/transferase [Flammeovirga sp. SubArs3]
MKNLLLGGMIISMCGVIAAFKTSEVKKKRSKPNVIVIMCDDLGYRDVGFNGCKDIPTPNIDRIANNGIRFTNAYVSYSVCGPSRAGFITGRYQQRFGFERNPQYKADDPNMGLPKSEKTLATVLKTQGYHSGIIGKWHLGAHESNHPMNRGFDEFYGHLGGGHSYYPELLTIEDSYGKDLNEPDSYKTWIMKNHKPVKTDKYLTYEFSDEAVSFVKRNADEPFFLYLSYNAPHTPMHAPKDRLPQFDHIKDPKRKKYAAMVSAVDEGVGRVLDQLKASGIEENTIIYFLSDNGGPEPKNKSNNGELRDGKGSVYEGGFRVPFAMSWPGHIKPATYDNMISSLDIFATTVALADAKMDVERPLDGVNLVPYVTGKDTGMPHETIYLRKYDQKKYAVRHKDYKIVRSFADGKNVTELYDLSADISEKTNVKSQHPDQVKLIEDLRVQWDKELIDPIFLGLIHSDYWKAKAAKKAKKKKAQ